jgi:hypothetical protein
VAKTFGAGFWLVALFFCHLVASAQAVVQQTNCPTNLPVNTIVAAQSVTSVANYPVVILACYILDPTVFSIDSTTMPPTIRASSFVPVTYNSQQYNFAPVAGTGTLSSGVSYATSFNPCPAGVSGTYTNNYLQLSNPTEAVKITGGTCNGNGSSPGTITYIPTTNHTAGWTISSATLGIQEAEEVIAMAGTGGIITVPPGLFSQCGPVNIDTDSVMIRGSGGLATGTVVNPSFSTIQKGTTLQPCSANETLFNSLTGHYYGSTVSRLSMQDIGFRNNGLTGLTAIKLVYETNGTFDRLGFSCGANVMTAFDSDQSWNLRLSNITTSYCALSNFRSSTDTNAITNWPYTTVFIDHWVTQAGNFGAGQAVLTLQRCVSCVVSNSSFMDQALTVTGIAILLSNDSQGNVFLNNTSEGFLHAIQIVTSTVGTTTAGPGWTTISGGNYDCAGGTNCTGKPWQHITMDGSTYNTSIIGNKFSGLSGAGNNSAGVYVTGGNVTDQAIVNLFSNEFTVQQNQLIILASGNLTNPITISGNTFVPESPASAVLFAGTGNVTSFNFSSNTVGGTGQSIVPIGGATLAGPTIFGNLCKTDPNNYCVGSLSPPVFSKDINFIPTETGTTNNIAGALLGPGGNQIVLSTGLRVCVLLAHALTGGAINSFVFNGTNKGIVSGHNPSNQLVTSYAIGGIWCGIYNSAAAGGGLWLDLSQ